MASARTTARTARAPRPSMTAEEQEENDLFTAQLMSMMGTFEQLAKNPRMQKLLKTKDYRTGSQAETSQQATSRQRQVTEPVERVPTVVTGLVQHVTQAQDPARNGHRSNEQSMHPTIPMHTSFPGYFGAGSVFQSMIRASPGFQGYMPSTDLGMADPSRSYVRPMDLSGGTGVSPNTDIPLLKAPVYDSLTPKGKAKDYKEGGQAVKFEPFFGTIDRMKALIFLQQFDAAFTGRNFTEASKIRKAASFLKGNALQWWATLLNQGQVPSTWVQFKQIFAPAWLTSAFEVDVMTAWNQLSSVNRECLEEYNQMFWNAFLPVNSFKMVPLTEQVEKYCCGLPKGIRDYCTKTSVMNMTQLIENAMVADNLVRGKAEGFKNPSEEQTGKQVPAKTTQPKQPFWKEDLPKTASEIISAKQRKNLPSAGLVPDMVGDQPCDDASELCRAWGKIRDSTVLIFFDPGVRANYITPALAAKLGIRSEEMGLEGQADLACPGHSVPVTPILGKLRMHIQSYVDTEEFYIMSLEGCDVLLGMPWCHRKHAVLDAFNRKITLVHRDRTLTLDVKLKGESVPVASASAISSVMKSHLSAYLIFAKPVNESENVDAYVRSCLVYQKVKFDRQKAPGLLQPLPIPDRPWESIAMDFVFDLPRTTTGNDGIWTIICRFSKQAHFILVRKKIKSEHMVKIFMQNIFKYHGMPQSIVSDRDPRMTSLFWKALFENMGTTLKFSSSFHPQTDGQSEEVNSTVLDLLKCYVSEHKVAWEQYLPLVEYAYNNTVHSSTGKAPFKIVEGGKKVPPILHTKDKIFEPD
ncbi:hypothetical protein L7F22_025462 [Adiantum nelumboides]|nr:hypothetical protein [Adiantum nelumboides]